MIMQKKNIKIKKHCFNSSFRRIGLFSEETFCSFLFFQFAASRAAHAAQKHTAQPVSVFSPFLFDE